MSAGNARAAVSRNLILVASPLNAAEGDFEEIAEWVHAAAPDIDVTVMPDAPIDLPRNLLLPDRPSLIFSPRPIAAFPFRRIRGAVYQGIRLRKAQEYTALEAIGTPLPRWCLITRDTEPDLRAFGPYVVVKPNNSGRGADVRIKLKGRVRWSDRITPFTQRVAGPAIEWIVQEFIYTGCWPISYRVTTLFGEALWAFRVEGSHDRRPLCSRYGFRGGATGSGMSIVSAGKRCIFALCDDPDIIALAQRAHAAFPHIPLLGVDIVRDADSGDLYVIEVNAVGYTWHFSSPRGIKIQREFGFRFEDQFDGRRKASRLLVDWTRRFAQ